MIFCSVTVDLQRILDLRRPLESRSLFLLGPRQVGKTTYLKQAFPEVRQYNLLDSGVFRDLSMRPELLRERLQPRETMLILDEVQRLPELLNEAQIVIDRNPEFRFVFTGSSARKLRRGGANMLGGRAWMARMHPLVAPELDFGMLEERLTWGSLPHVLLSGVAEEELHAYLGTYLMEEIQAEGAVRSIGSFSRFLPVAALANGEQLNFTAIGNDCQVPPRLVREYVQILEDTLIGHVLEPFQGTKKRKPVATAKLYLFDVGIANALVGRGKVRPGTEGFGKALEHQIFLEIRAWLDYTRQINTPLMYWRSKSQLEVDFVLGDRVGIEVKASQSVARRDFKGLLALAEEIPLKRKIVVCMERERRRTEEGVEVVPVEDFLRDLWADQLKY